VSGRSIKQQTNNKQQAKLTPPDSALKVVVGWVCLSIQPLPGVNSRTDERDEKSKEGCENCRHTGLSASEPDRGVRDSHHVLDAGITFGLR
jgi:hypothetical protein